jgi:DNA-binding response OmpR family regulator
MRENDIPTDVMDQSRKKRILVVDDDEQIVELFVDVLSRDDRFEVRTAGTGYEAGLLTEQFKPDLIVLDFMLPDINGNVVCRSVRQKPELADTRIIIVSGVVKQDEIDDLLKAGADDFVKKPFNIEKLLARIHELLEL